MMMATSGKISLYNLFADLCSYVVSTHTKNYLVRYSCISKEERVRIEKKILEGTPLRLDSNKEFRQLHVEDLTEDFLGSLKHFAHVQKKTDDENCIMRLLQALDQALRNMLLDEIERFGSQNATYELNTNRMETGIELLPRCSCVWTRKSRQSFSYRRIDNYLQNLMVIEERDVAEIADEHHFIPKGFFPKFDKTHKLKVASSPLSSKMNFDIRYHKINDLQVFSLAYHKDEVNRQNDLVWSKILEAGRDDAEVIVFPEMMGNASMEGNIAHRLASLTDEEREHVPCMIILPTYYVDGKNYSVILDKHGNRLATQYKQNPYIMKVKHGEYMENITGSSVIEIFHYEGLGRFAILICKDFLTTRYMEHIMRGFMLTLIFVPAFSTGSYDFKMSFDLCAHDHCNVVWINSCAAMIPGKEDNFRFIGYVRKRTNRYQNESERLKEMHPCKKLFKGGCEHNCIYYDTFGEV